MPPPPSAERKRWHWRATRTLTAVVLALWFGLTFGVAYFARALDGSRAGGGWGFWAAAQGAPLGYLGLVGLYAWWMNRLDAGLDASGPP
jgi:putative solute:sodium symporter small subunit